MSTWKIIYEKMVCFWQAYNLFDIELNHLRMLWTLSCGERVHKTGGQNVDHKWPTLLPTAFYTLRPQHADFYYNNYFF